MRPNYIISFYKALSTWIFLQTLTFLLLASIFSIPLKNLVIPCVWLAAVGIFAMALICDAQRYRERPNAFTIRTVSATFLLSAMPPAIVATFAPGLGLFGHEFASYVLFCGLAGALVASVVIYKKSTALVQRNKKIN